MPLINDPDDLNQNTEIVVDFVAETIQLLVAGNLDNDGALGAAVYAFLKLFWNSDPTAPRYPFPMLAIDNDAGKFVMGQSPVGFNNWRWADDTTRTLLRSCAWQEFNAAGTLLREYIAPFSGDGVQPASQPYFGFANSASPTDFDFPGPVDQGIQTFGAAGEGAFDSRNQVLTIFVREPNRLYDQQVSTALPQLATNLKPIFAPLALNEGNDLNIVDNDVTVDGSGPYTGMSITYHATPQSIAVGAVSYDFGVTITCNNGVAEQVYTYAQRRLRLDGDINSGAPVVNGKLADLLLEFVGNRLDTLAVNNPAGGGSGVALVGFNSNDTNRLRFIDNTLTYRSFPFVSAGSIEPNSNLQSDAASRYTMFFVTNPAGDYGTSSAVIVEDNSGSPITGLIGGQASISFDFDYDGNVQGGRTAGTDASVIVVAIGEDGAQYTVGTATITRATGIVITLTSALERNFENP